MRSILLCISLWLLGSLSVAAEDRRADRGIKAIPDSQNQIIKLTDRGIEPQVLKMTKADSIVFFLNSSTDSLTTLEIDYGKKRTHCASTSLEIGADGKVRSVEPFGPRDFASVCFPDQGRYPVTIYGLKTKPSGLSSTIIVE